MHCLLTFNSKRLRSEELVHRSCCELHTHNHSTKHSKSNPFYLAVGKLTTVVPRSITK